MYDGRIYSEKTENIDSNVQNKSYLFIFDVKNVPVSSKEEKENEDEDEDAEFRICALLDKNKNYNQQVTCKNIIVDDTRENVTFELK